MLIMANNTGQKPDMNAGDPLHGKLRKRLWRAKLRLGSYRALAEKLGINVGYLQPFVVHGKEPTNRIVRRALGLPNRKSPGLGDEYRKHAWFWEHQLRYTTIRKGKNNE